VVAEAPTSTSRTIRFDAWLTVCRLITCRSTGATSYNSRYSNREWPSLPSTIRGLRRTTSSRLDRRRFATLTRISVDGATINDRVTGGTSQTSHRSRCRIPDLNLQLRHLDQHHQRWFGQRGLAQWLERLSRLGVHCIIADHNLSGYPLLKRDSRTRILSSRASRWAAAIGGPLKKDRAFSSSTASTTTSIAWCW